jgi:hypothetical protein
MTDVKKMEPLPQFEICPQITAPFPEVLCHSILKSSRISKYIYGDQIIFSDFVPVAMEII